MNKTTLFIYLCCAFLFACSSTRDEANSAGDNQGTGTYSSGQYTVGFDNPLNHNTNGEEILSSGNNEGKLYVHSMDFKRTADVIEEMDEVDEAILVVVNQKAFVGVKLLDKDQEISDPLKTRIKNKINRNIPNIEAIHITTDIAFLKELESQGGLKEIK